MRIAAAARGEDAFAEGEFREGLEDGDAGCDDDDAAFKAVKGLLVIGRVVVGILILHCPNYEFNGIVLRKC